VFNLGKQQQAAVAGTVFFIPNNFGHDASYRLEPQAQIGYSLFAYRGLLFFVYLLLVKQIIHKIQKPLSLFVRNPG